MMSEEKEAIEGNWEEREGTSDELPMIEYVDLMVEKPETRVVDRISHVEVVNVIEEIRYVRRQVEVERVVEVPQIEFREYAVERLVEIPEVVEQVVVKEVEVPQYVEVEEPVIVEKEVIVEVARNVPVGLESLQHVDFEVPRIRVEFEEVAVPCYVPMFVELPIPVEQLDEASLSELEAINRDITLVTSTSFPSLTAMEDLTSRVKAFVANVTTDPQELLDHWRYMARQGSRRTIPRFSPPDVHAETKLDE